MKTVYLLPLGIQEVQYSFIKEDLENSLKVKGLPNYTILTAQLEDEVAEKLKDPAFVALPFHKREVPNSYYKDVESFLDNPPDWFKNDGMRLYIMFNNRRECYWSPSGNNLNSFYNKNPEYYFTQAIRVELDRQSYINIYSYFNYLCDNF